MHHPHFFAQSPSSLTSPEAAKGGGCAWARCKAADQQVAHFWLKQSLFTWVCAEWNPPQSWLTPRLRDFSAVVLVSQPPSSAGRWQKDEGILAPVVPGSMSLIYLAMLFLLPFGTGFGD